MGHRPASSSVSRLIFVYFAAIAFVSIASFGVLSYWSKEKVLLQGIDRQLATGAYAVAQALPADWQDRETASEADDYKNVLSLTTLAMRERSEMLPQPVRHVRVVDSPRLLERLVLLPGVLSAVEEPLPVALVLDDGVAFEPVLVPVVVLLPVAVPLLGLVDRRHEVGV